MISIKKIKKTMTDIQYMQEALGLAKKAASLDEVPVGAIVVHNGNIIGTGYNQPISKCDPSAHAEIIAMKEAALQIKNYRLLDTTMYVTLEPCPMCAYAMLHARIRRLVYACVDPKSGAIGGSIDLFNMKKWNHKVVCEQGPLESECREVLQGFFKARR